MTEEPLVEAFNGSFYNHYKRGAQEFIDFVRKVGKDGLASGVLQPTDLHAVQRGLSLLDSKGPELFPLLSKIIDEDNPSDWDECVVENIWSLMGAVFLIGQHSGITRSAKAVMTSGQSARARLGKAPKDEIRKAKQRTALQTILGNRDLSQPDSAAAWVFRDPGRHSKLVRAAQELGINKFSEATARRRIREISAQS